MKIIKSNARIMKIIKVVEFYVRQQHHENHRFNFENHETHEHLRISLENHENHENL